jgi:hypothetical protein
MVPNDQNKVYSHIEDELNEENICWDLLFPQPILEQHLGCIQLQHIG